MRIAALLPHLGVYGGVRRFLELGNRLVRRGHRFTIYVADGSKSAWLPFEGEVRPLEDAAATVHDALLCGDPSVLPVLAEAPARLRVLLVLGPRYVKKYRALCRPDWLVVGVASDWNRYFPDVSGITLPGGVNVETFRRVPVDRKEGSSPEARGAKEFHVLAFGRPDKRVKGSATVLRALAPLGRSGLRLTLFDREEIRLPWWARGEWVRTVVAPPQEGLPGLYSAADVFVSGEVSAGWSNSVAEAMACGTPVVATPCGTADLAIDGTTALVVPPKDPKAMRAAVERLRGDEGLRARLAAAARAHVERFSWERCAERWEQVLEERL